MRITEKRRSCLLSANRLTGKMKFPSSPWGSEPWACSLIGPGGNLGRRKPLKVLQRLGLVALWDVVAAISLEKLLC